MDLVGRWGLFPRFDEHGAQHVHPDDLDALRELNPYCKLFFCEAREDFLVLRYQDESYRVTVELFEPVRAPAFTFNERVVVVKCGEAAVVNGIMWHYKRSEPMFFLIKDGKLRSRRYWTDELRKAN